MQRKFRTIKEAGQFSARVNGTISYPYIDTSDNSLYYLVEWYDKEKESVTFGDMWEHYRVQYKDRNSEAEELFSIEALGFLKALRLLYPEHINRINKEIAITLSQLMIKVLGDD